VRSSPDGSDWTLVDAHAPFAVRAFQAAASFQGRLWVIGGTSVKADYNDVWYMESP
jgi:autotransporter translocation and assembly factor TamB